ncbi:hypothetical protein HU200_035659 [Digitaria exilis]|uniref:Methyltransferase-like protein 5 n=1 Tax=Digitaria exilis TaxID=1010633 RepID=A0A835EL93_9POAL|nr:hypothetical protein HU200_035659 [Digitaria exilis]
MKLKQLEGLLGGLTQFPAPKVELEQYPTGPHIASRMLYTVSAATCVPPPIPMPFPALLREGRMLSFSSRDGFGMRSVQGFVCDASGIMELGAAATNCSFVVADFGCGCGTLAVASALLDAEHVIGIDVDPQALELAQENAADLEMDVDLIWSDIKNLNLKGILVDTVVMNPPFGTRKKGADMEFLSMGLKHIKKAALRDCNAISAEVLCELRYDLPQTYKFHKKKEVDIAVDLWRFVPNARRSS